MDHNTVEKTEMMSIIWTPCVVCTGREAANECLVALLLSHSERPQYIEVVETANTAHQILSAAALVSLVWEATRESDAWQTRLFIQKQQ